MEKVSTLNQMKCLKLLKGQILIRSTDKENINRLESIHNELEPIFSKDCLAPSDYSKVKPLLHEAFEILHSSDSNQVVAQGAEFQGYLQKILNQNQSDCRSGFVEEESTDEDDDVWKSHITSLLPTKNIGECEDACRKSDHCDYYIFNDNGVDINCFFGDFKDTNPMEFNNLLKGIVTIHLKDSEKKE